MAIQWRFIDSGFHTGKENMVTDNALIENFDPDTTPPAFRIYGWKPPALSLGRFQKAGEVLNMDLIAETGVDFVNRITGGGIIHHNHEITYSLVCSQKDLKSDLSVKESFEKLNGFLLLFYKKLGLSASFAKDVLQNEKLGFPSTLCYAGKEEYDIIIEGKKIGGNAQRRLKNIIFQHGSIPISYDPEFSIKFLKNKPPQIDNHATSLSNLGIKKEWSEFKNLLKDAFRNIWV